MAQLDSISFSDIDNQLESDHYQINLILKVSI